MAAPLEREGFEGGPTRRRRVLIARQARLARERQDRSGGISIGMLFALTAVVVPVLAVATAIVGATRFYDSAVRDLDTPANMLAAVANYGGAQIFDRNGVLLYRFPESDGGFRFPARLDQVSQNMIDATVSTEDANFWQHGGVDFRGILTAAYQNTMANGNPFEGRGGSGITQQLVKQTLIPPEERTAQSVSRKLQEAIYATEIANHYSREQILEWYLNVTNYGGVYNGVETAAQGYFGVHASELTLAQAAMLAGIPQSPALHSPYLNPEGAKWRQGQVLDLMVQHRYITQEEADEAKREPIEIRKQEEALPLRAPWFVEYVRQELVARFGEQCVARCGLKVTTTLDINLQDEAQATLQKNLETYADPIGAHNGAVVSLDARSGEILVMVGSRDYNDESPEVRGSNNFATSILQPGSAFKPFVYMTLFMKQGYGPSSIIWDEPFVTSDGYRCENPGVAAKTYGAVPVKLALGSSLNCPANRAAATVGIQNVLDVAKTMGITTLGEASQYGPAIATGGANITLLDMAHAYATLARNGSMIGAPSLKKEMRPLDPVALRQVVDATGRTLFDYQPQTAQVVDAAYPALITSILSDCNNRRLIWSCSFPTFRLADGRPVAAKTGTQQGNSLKESAGNWLFMYTPNLVTGGWVGNANRAGWTDINGASNAVGYTVQQVEDAIVEAYDIPAEPFGRPDNIVEVSVRVPDGTRGTGTSCGGVEKGLFVRGTAPDVNNRVCVNGRLTVPAEQLGSGGLKAIPLPTPTPTPAASSLGAILSPSSGETVSGGVLILARAPANARVAIQWGTGASPSSWTSLSTASLSPGQFYAGWEASRAAPGIYSIRLMVDEQSVSQILVRVGSGGGTAPPGATPTPAQRGGATPTPTPTSTRSRTTIEPPPAAATPAVPPPAALP